MGENESSKWEGEITVEIALTPEQVWPLIADFCSLYKWFPHIENSYLVEGEPGKPGLIRCCESTQFGGEGVAKYAKEKLLTIDPSEMSLSYEILDNNAGFKSYDATVRLFPINDDDGKCRCKYVWTFVADPVEGFTLDALREMLNGIAQGMAKKMEEHYSQNSVN